MPGGAVPGVSGGSEYAGARVAGVPLPGGRSPPPPRKHQTGSDAAAGRRGRDGLGPRLPAPPRAPGLRSAELTQGEQQQQQPALFIDSA